MNKQEHIIDKSDIEITSFEMNRIFEVSPFPLDVLLSNFFCSECHNISTKTIINYKVYINKINDTIFRGECSNCKNLAARYLETSEIEEPLNVTKAIRKNRSKK